MLLWQLFRLLMLLLGLFVVVIVVFIVVEFGLLLLFGWVFLIVIPHFFIHLY